jgi:hypothetical protein
MAQLRTLLSSRMQAYARARHHLDTSGRQFEQSLSELVALAESDILSNGVKA